VLYLQLLKALYGCVKAALLWYELFSGTLQKMGFTTDHNDGVSILLKGSIQALRILQTLLRQIIVVGGNDDGDNGLDTTNHHSWVQPWLPDLGLAVAISNDYDFDSSSAKMSRSSIGDGGTSINNNHNLLLLLFRCAMEIQIKACMSKKGS
jgi:hypothetical protein